MVGDQALTSRIREQDPGWRFPTETTENCGDPADSWLLLINKATPETMRDHASQFTEVRGYLRLPLE